MFPGFLHHYNILRLSCESRFVTNRLHLTLSPLLAGFYESTACFGKKGRSQGYDPLSLAIRLFSYGLHTLDSQVLVKSKALEACLVLFPYRIVIDILLAGDEPCLILAEVIPDGGSIL